MAEALPAVCTLDALTEYCSAMRRAERRVVLCHGCFDLLHIGHIRHFKEARTFGDALVVTITPDRFVQKGPGRPAFPAELRAEAVAALSAVDRVAINRWPTAVETMKMLRPAVFCKGFEFHAEGSDPTGKIELERTAAADLGVEIRFTDDLIFSSSELLRRLG
jgi:cytidyltransferase-like protein